MFQVMTELKKKSDGNINKMLNILIFFVENCEI